MASWKYLILAFIVLIWEKQALCQLSKNKDELLNWCLISTSHKTKPGKEDSLHGECTPWKDHACCTSETSLDLHSKNMYNFTLDHCFGKVGKNMSSKCRSFFFRNNCFYECEPHIGLWVVQTSRRIADQRFSKVPLCASECDSWWDACKEDYTCAYNWPRDFRFKNGHNYCPENKKCKTFEKIYANATDFCENVWDDSFVYTPDTENCMRIWFNGSKGNPNRKVAEYYINKRIGSAGALSSSVFLCLTMFIMYLIF